MSPSRHGTHRESDLQLRSTSRRADTSDATLDDPPTQISLHRLATERAASPAPAPTLPRGTAELMQSPVPAE